MFGIGIPLLVVVAALTGIVLWVRRSRPEEAKPPVEVPTRRVSVLTEAVVYIGTILVLTGSIVAVGQQWHRIATTGRLIVLTTVTLIFLAVGWAFRSSTEPAFRRLTAVTWAVSVGAFAGSAGVATQYYETPGQTVFVIVATTSTALAALLWWLHGHAIQQAVVYVGVLLSTASIINRIVTNPDPWMIAVPLWAISVGWVAAGWWRRITPWFVAVPLGLLVALIAPATIGEPNALRFGLGLATAGAVMALSVVATFTPGLAMGSVAMLGYLIGAVIYYFGDALGVSASLAISGLFILALAAVAVRWHWFSHRTPPAQPGPTADRRTPGEDHHLAA